MTPSTDLEVVSADKYAVVSQPLDQLREVITENLGADGISAFDLTRVTIPPGGGRQWQVPTLTGIDDRKHIDGVIVFWRQPRAFWQVGFDESGGGSPPDCSSDDSDIGNGMFGPGSHGNPTGECKKCPMAQWKSDPSGGNGQACKQMRLLYLLEPTKLLPMALFMPPTSIRPMKNYFLQLSSESTPYHAVITRLELEQTKGGPGGGITYSVVKPHFLAKLEPEQHEAVKAYAEHIRTALSTMQITTEDYATVRSSDQADTL